MARPKAENEKEQQRVRDAYVWMAHTLRELAKRGEIASNPLKQQAVAPALGIDQSCLSRWLSGRTVTLQKPQAWEKLLDVLCEARKHLPLEGWAMPGTYWYSDNDNVIRNLDFKGESTTEGIRKKAALALCDHRCDRCHGLTPKNANRCMHCGKPVSPQEVDLDMDIFLLPGDSWGVDVY